MSHSGQDRPKLGDRFNPVLVGTTAATHFGGDFYGSLFSPLLPLLMDKFALSLGLVGVLATIQSMSGSLTQPFFGYLADKRIRGGLLIGGLLISAVFMSGVAIVPNVAILVLFLILGELGISLSHPVAASLASKASANRPGLGMSIYMTGGSIGYALGPLVVVKVADRYGLEGVPYLALMGLALAVVIFLGARQIPVQVSARRATSLRESFSGRSLAIGLLVAIVMLRAVVSVSFGTYLPVFLTRRGTSLVLAGASITIFRLAGTLGGLLGGPLSDRIGRHLTLMFSSLGAIPFLWLFLQQPGAYGFVFLALSAVFINLANPAQVLTAQSLVPQSIGVVSGLTMGFSWGLASFGTTLVGFLGEAIGLGPALNIVVVVSLLAATVLVPVLRAASR